MDQPLLAARRGWWRYQWLQSMQTKWTSLLCRESWIPYHTHLLHDTSLLPLTSQVAGCSQIHGWVYGGSGCLHLSLFKPLKCANHGSVGQIWWPHQSQLCELLLSLSHALGNEQYVGVSDCPFPHEYMAGGFQCYLTLPPNEIFIMCTKKKLSTGVTWSYALTQVMEQLVFV